MRDFPWLGRQTIDGLSASSPFSPGSRLSPTAFPASIRLCFESADAYRAFFSSLYFTANFADEDTLQIIEEAAQRWLDGCSPCEFCETLQQMVENSEGTVEGFLLAFLDAVLDCCIGYPFDFASAIAALEWPTVGGEGMIGDIVWSAASSRPNSLLCDGSEYEAADYPELFALLPEALKTEDTFVVPDLRGRALIGAGQGIGLTERGLAEELGTEAETLTIDQMPSHNHPGYDINKYSQFALGTRGASFDSLGPYSNSANTGYKGGGAAHNNMQPSAAYNAFIIANA